MLFRSDRVSSCAIVPAEEETDEAPPGEAPPVEPEAVEPEAPADDEE